MIPYLLQEPALSMIHKKIKKITYVSGRVTDSTRQRGRPCQSVNARQRQGRARRHARQRSLGTHPPRLSVQSISAAANAANRSPFPGRQRTVYPAVDRSARKGEILVVRHCKNIPKIKNPKIQKKSSCSAPQVCIILSVTSPRLSCGSNTPAQTSNRTLVKRGEHWCPCRIQLIVNLKTFYIHIFLLLVFNLKGFL